MKILLFGGSFDPVHQGHVKLLSNAVKAERPYAVHVVPAFHSPFKEKTATPFALRKAMAEVMFKGIKANIIYDDFEFKNNRKTYTCEVIKYLKERYSGAQILLLTGEDCTKEIHTWKNASYIFDNCKLVSGKRTAEASSALRVKIMCSGIVPASISKIKNIIEANNLYFLNVHAWLKQNLKPARYRHTLYVCKLIAELADIYNVNKERAVLSALLHDAAKGMAPAALVDYANAHKIAAPHFDLMSRYEPELLHPYVSADIAKKLFNVTEPDILAAIAAHTLGAENMDTLAKVLYVADAGSRDRRYPSASKIRALAVQDLHQAMLETTRMKLTFSLKTNKWLAPEGNKTWNRLILKKE